MYINTHNSPIKSFKIPELFLTKFPMLLTDKMAETHVFLS